MARIQSVPKWVIIRHRDLDTRYRLIRPAVDPEGRLTIVAREVTGGREGAIAHLDMAAISGNGSPWRVEQ